MPDETAVWREAVACFEAGDYWESHEVLEPLWLASSGLDRDLTGGVILLAAALHKARTMGSPRGGRRNFAKALRHLAVVPDDYRGVDVRALEAAVHAGLRDPSLPVPWAGTVPRAAEPAGATEEASA
jgi:uncharacterized protein